MDAERANSSPNSSQRSTNSGLHVRTHSPSPSTVNLNSLATKTLRQGGSEAIQAKVRFQFGNSSFSPSSHPHCHHNGNESSLMNLLHLLKGNTLGWSVLEACNLSFHWFINSLTGIVVFLVSRALQWTQNSVRR